MPEKVAAEAVERGGVASSDVREFLDAYDTFHRTRRELARGGQGVVYETDDPQLLLKIAIPPDNLTEEERTAFVERRRSHYHKVRLLPIPEGIHLALPLVALKQEAGYVMECLQEMEPFSALLPGAQRKEKTPEDAELPVWVQSIASVDGRRHWAHYVRTGGLQRRLLALARLAEILARLELQGLVYGDVSPENVFLSKLSQRQLNVWLIDADNVRWADPSVTEAMCTPGYGAPELVRGTVGASFYSDAYAFAVLAFQVLTTQMPFDGQLLAGDDAGWDVPDGTLPAEERAARGELPWLEDAEDDSNGDVDAGNATLRHLLLTPELLRLFEATFGRTGREQPASRPSLAVWARELLRAADDLVCCESCGTYYYGGPELRTTCPYCDHAQESAWLCTAMVRQADGSFGGDVWRYRMKQATGKLPLRLLAPYALHQAEASAAEFSEQRGQLLLGSDFFSGVKLACAAEATHQRFQEVRARLKLGATDAVRTCYLLTGPRAPRLVTCTKGGGGNGC